PIAEVERSLEIAAFTRSPIELCERNSRPRHIADGAPGEKERGERQPDKDAVRIRPVDEIRLAQPPIVEIGIVLLSIDQAITDRSCPVNIILAPAQQIGVDDLRIVIGETRAQ